jgi:hypothetical protein
VTVCFLCLIRSTASPHLSPINIPVLPVRLQENSAHIRQSGPDFGLGFQVKVFKTFFWLFSCRSEAGQGICSTPNLPRANLASAIAASAQRISQVRFLPLRGSAAQKISRVRFLHQRILQVQFLPLHSSFSLNPDTCNLNLHILGILELSQEQGSVFEV